MTLYDDMRYRTIFAGPAAIVLMICYYSIPFLIVAGVSESLANLRPFLVSGSLLLIVLGVYECLRSRHSNSQTSELSTVVLLFSAVVVFA